MSLRQFPVTTPRAMDGMLVDKGRALGTCLQTVTWEVVVVPASPMQAAVTMAAVVMDLYDDGSRP